MQVTPQLHSDTTANVLMLEEGAESPRVNQVVKTQKIATENLPCQIQEIIAEKKKLEDPKEKGRVYHQALKKWSKNDLKSCQNRARDYVDENTTKALLNGPVLVGGSVLAGAALGAGIGAGVGFAIAGPTGLPPGALIGAGVGAGIGLTVSVPVASIKIRSDFIDWKRDGRLGAMLPALLKLYQDNKTMEWLCPLTTELFSYPVFIPTGITYEKSAIVNYLKQNDGSAMDPCKSMVISEQDLFTDFAVLGAILAALEKLARADLKKLGLNSDIRKGLLSALRDLNAQVKECETNGRILIKHLYDKEKISGKVYKKYQADLNRLITDSDRE